MDLLGEFLKALQANWPGLVVAGLFGILLGGVPSFFLGRLSKRLDRRQEAKDKRADFLIEHAGTTNGREVVNMGTAPALKVQVEGSIVLRGFEPVNLVPGERKRFFVNANGGTVTVMWQDAKGKKHSVERQIPPPPGKRQVRLVTKAGGQ